MASSAKLYHLNICLYCVCLFHYIMALFQQGLSAGLLRQATYTTARLGSFRWVSWNCYGPVFSLFLIVTYLLTKHTNTHPLHTNTTLLISGLIWFGPLPSYTNPNIYHSECPMETCEGTYYCRSRINILMTSWWIVLSIE